jgi:hypothetical protein
MRSPIITRAPENAQSTHRKNFRRTEGDLGIIGVALMGSLNRNSTGHVKGTGSFLRQSCARLALLTHVTELRLLIIISNTFLRAIQNTASLRYKYQEMKRLQNGRNI